MARFSEPPACEVSASALLDSVQLVRVRGKLDGANVTALRERLRKAAEAGAGLILLDLSECPLVDETGLAAIMNGARELRNAGAGFIAITSSAEVVRLFEETAVGESVPLFPTLESVLALLDGGGISPNRPS